MRRYNRLILIGRIISHYKILEKLGEGGMGVVYKAEDTKLKRQVALKFLPAHLLGDDEVKARFEREAQAAAALDHPNICTVYEIDQAEDQTFLAMAFLKGQTLEEHIAEGPMPLDKALDIARQVAEGLSAAHAENIVHRDIKPANILVSPEGRATIMDFGLARLTEASRLTKREATMGTVAYMSPEQAEGGEVDNRTDLWALGVVLYEMVAGQRPFTGQYDQALFYEIVNQEHEPLTSIRAGLPMELEFIVGKCMAKSADDRYSAGSDIVTDLRTLSAKLKSGRSTILSTQINARQKANADPNPIWAQRAAPANSSPIVPSAKGNLRLYKSLLAVTTLFALTTTFLYLNQSAPPALLRRFAFTPREAVDTDRTRSGVAISPNGKHIAYTTADAEGTLWIQDLDQSQPRKLEGTERAYLPFWSPDSNFIGFAAGGELNKISVEGGLSIRLCPLPSSLFAGGAWSPGGESIVLGSGSYEIYEVPARGGDADLLISPEPSDSSSGGPTGILARPHFLPHKAGERVLVYTFGPAGQRTLIVDDLESGRREILGPGTHPFYSPSGHLIYQSELSTFELWALPYSLDTLQATGEAFPVVQDSRGPTVAADRTLVYLDG